MAGADPPEGLERRDGYWQFDARGHRVNIPQACCCCLGAAEVPRSYHALEHDILLKSIPIVEEGVESKSRRWEFMYCRACVSHIRRYRAGCALGGASAVGAIWACWSTGLISPLTGLGAACIVMVPSAILCGWLASQKTRPGCSSRGDPVGVSVLRALWFKNYTFTFANEDYARLFAEANPGIARRKFWAQGLWATEWSTLTGHAAVLAAIAIGISLAAALHGADVLGWIRGQLSLWAAILGRN